MQKQKMTPMVTLVASLAAGVETEVVVDENGVVYLPAFQGQFKSGAAPKAVSTETTTTAAAPKASAGKSQTYTEQELMDMDVKTLEKMCIKMDIEIPEDGKRNTNKKLRDLILEAQEGNDGGDDEDAEEKPTRGAAKEKPTVSKGVIKEVAAILAKVDKGSLDGDAGEAALFELCATKAQKTSVRKLYDEFLNDNSLDIDNVAKDIAAEIDGEETEEEEKPTRGGRGAAKAAPAKEATSDVMDFETACAELAADDRVSVYWEAESKWFKGTVASNKKGVVTIDYDDETTAELDEDENTKVKLID